MTAPSSAEAPHRTGEVVYIPDGWTLWRNGSDTASRYWTNNVVTDGHHQIVSTLPTLDEPKLRVQSPIVRTYPGIYFLPERVQNPYEKDLRIDVIMPTSLDFMGAAPPQTENERLLHERATRLYEENQRQLQTNDGNLYIPDGEVLVRVVEPERPDDTAARRIVYVPEPYYAEYQRLQTQAGAS